MLQYVSADGGAAPAGNLRCCHEHQTSSRASSLHSCMASGPAGVDPPPADLPACPHMRVHTVGASSAATTAVERRSHGPGPTHPQGSRAAGLAAAAPCGQSSVRAAGRSSTKRRVWQVRGVQQAACAPSLWSRRPSTMSFTSLGVDQLCLITYCSPADVSGSQSPSPLHFGRALLFERGRQLNEAHSSLGVHDFVGQFACKRPLLNCR